MVVMTLILGVMNSYNLFRIDWKEYIFGMLNRNNWSESD